MSNKDINIEQSIVEDGLYSQIVQLLNDTRKSVVIRVFFLSRLS